MDKLDQSNIIKEFANMQKYQKIFIKFMSRIDIGFTKPFTKRLEQKSIIIYSMYNNKRGKNGKRKVPHLYHFCKKTFSMTEYLPVFYACFVNLI